jgi:lysophospholipase L1-like esterase
VVPGLLPDAGLSLRLIVRRATFIAYLLLVHGLLALMLWKSDFVSRVQRRLGPAREITDQYNQMLAYQANMDGNVPDKSVVFIGDSLTQALCTDGVTCPSVNYGIAGDTTVGVLARLPKYQCIRRASAVVLAIGVNDMKFRDNQQIIQNYTRILNALPQGMPVVCSAVLPIDEGIYAPRSVVKNARIAEFNGLLKTLCSRRSQCIFVDAGNKLADQTGNLSAAFQAGGGVHLNAAGNRIWIDELRKAIGIVREPKEGQPMSNSSFSR